MLSDKVVQKVIAVIELVETVPIVPAKYFRKLVGTELFEFRIRWERNIYRLLCFFDRNNTVVITHGFMKKTQRTPRREIDRAERYRRDYFARRQP
ncbi:MAG: type II toxin-antitoxin system RelE/ParE family toxin [Spirochaetaceae bacterium]|nr:type II toxin-antitoxin system RelE/ParE family toxin [Spirochaetaceae bacterium]